MSVLSQIVYEPQDTLLHRMNPLAKIMLYLFIMLLSSIWWHPIYLTIMYLCCLALWWNAKIPKFTRRLVIGLSVLLVIGQIYTHPAWLFMGDPRFFKVIPKDVITQLSFYFPWKGFPLGYIAITLGSLIYLYSNMLHIFIPIYTMVTALYTLNPSDIIQILTRLKVPNQIIFVFIALFRFFPLFGRTTQNIINAQTLRGWSLKTRNPIKVVKESAPLMYPLGRKFISMIQEVTFSVSNRGFEATGKMAPLRVYTAKWWENVMIYVPMPLFALLWYLTSIPPYIGAI
jgi:energy-coupling factor transport system permease protein